MNENVDRSGPDAKKCETDSEGTEDDCGDHDTAEY